MPAGRFIVSPTLLADGAEIELPADVAHQARDVLRLAPGDALTLLDGIGGEWPATLTRVDRARVLARVAPRQSSAADPQGVQLILCQGMLKAAKFEWVLQKGTELGVAAFVPVLSERAVAGAEEPGGSRRARWQRILAEATEQCGRARIPTLADPQPLAHALASMPAGAIALIPWEGEHATPLRAALTTARSAPLVSSDAGTPSSSSPLSPLAVVLFIGPEGGFSTGEIALAARHGAIPVTLGPRILRAETAALAAATLVMETCGELG